MSNEQHHSLEKFKAFVRKHPSLVQEVRRGIYTWQEIYEDWYLLGEEHDIWRRFRDPGAAEERVQESPEDKKIENEAVSSFLDSLKNVDVQSMQKHVSNLSQALGAISGVISQFQSPPKEKEKEKETSKPKKPFSMHRD
ncbi:MAG: spore coat protein YlbD [Bacillus sp. (in: firmicutes)]